LSGLGVNAMAPISDDLIGLGSSSVENKGVLAPAGDVGLNVKDVKQLEQTINANSLGPDVDLKEAGITSVKTDRTNSSDETDEHDDEHSSDKVIITAADATKYLLPMRDDGDPALTLRGVFLATCLAAFQAVMSQIYYVSSILYRIWTSFRFLQLTQMSFALYSSSQLLSRSRAHSSC
jgi:hypothetical protein